MEEVQKLNLKRIVFGTCCRQIFLTVFLHMFSKQNVLCPHGMSPAKNETTKCTHEMGCCNKQKCGKLQTDTSLNALLKMFFLSEKFTSYKGLTYLQNKFFMKLT